MSFTIDEPAIKKTLSDLYIMGSIHDTHTNYTVLFGACDHTQSKKALRINRIGFLPIVNKKDVKQEIELRRKIISPQLRPAFSIFLLLQIGLIPLLAMIFRRSHLEGLKNILQFASYLVLLRIIKITR